MTRGEDKGNKRCREEHLDDGDITIVAAENSREGIGVVDAEAFGGAWSAREGQRTAPDLRAVCQVGEDDGHI